jgi:hypothetical protein
MTIFRRGEQVTYEVVADEAILIDMYSGTYFSLNEVGTVFWQSLDGEKTLAQIALEIAASYKQKATDFVAALKAIEAENASLKLPALSEKFGVDEALAKASLEQVQKGESTAVIGDLSAPADVVRADLLELAATLLAEQLITSS